MPVGLPWPLPFQMAALSWRENSAAISAALLVKLSVSMACARSERAMRYSSCQAENVKVLKESSFHGETCLSLIHMASPTSSASCTAMPPWMLVRETLVSRPP